MQKLLMVALLVLGGCGAARLRPGAARVMVLPELPTDATYSPVGEVSCSLGSNFGTVSGNVDGCRNQIRNQAADLGADIILLTTQEVGAGRCDNCVVMYGIAYRRGN